MTSPHLRLLAVGGKASSWAREAEREYCKRLGKWQAEVVTVKPGRGPAALADEARRLEKHVLKGSALVATSSAGAAPTSEGFAKMLEGWMLSGGVTFIIGAAEGIDGSLLSKADAVLSFSCMTLAHDIARVVLLEQCYRSFTILEGHPYHRA